MQFRLWKFPPRVRLLPVLIVGVAMLLTVRLGELSLGVDLSATSPAAAAEDAEKPESAEDPTAEADSHDAEGEAEDELLSDIPVEFTPGEVAVLQDLAKRRNELEAFEKEVEARERLLDAAEGRLEERIAELTQLRDSIEGLVRQYNEQEAAELQSVVKIYETMKPKDAARILGEMEMPVLLGIMETMKERKSAPIIAAMEPERARELTTELARQREVELSTPADADEPSG